MTTRKLIFHPSRGVLLGARVTDEGSRLRWSRDNGSLTGEELAPTFADHAEFDGYLLSHGSPHVYSGYWMHEVKPTGPNHQATMADCTKVGIQRWGRGK